jgi:hypothetical protein
MPTDTINKRLPLSLTLCQRHIVPPSSRLPRRDQQRPLHNALSLHHQSPLCFPSVPYHSTENCSSSRPTHPSGACGTSLVDRLPVHPYSPAQTVPAACATEPRLPAPSLRERTYQLHVNKRSPRGGPHNTHSTTASVVNPTADTSTVPPIEAHCFQQTGSSASQRSASKENTVSAIAPSGRLPACPVTTNDVTIVNWVALRPRVGCWLRVSAVGCVLRVAAVGVAAGCWLRGCSLLAVGGVAAWLLAA